MASAEALGGPAAAQALTGPTQVVTAAAANVAPTVSQATRSQPVVQAVTHVATSAVHPAAKALQQTASAAEPAVRSAPDPPTVQPSLTAVDAKVDEAQTDIEATIASVTEVTEASSSAPAHAVAEAQRPLVGRARLEVRDVGRPVSDDARRRLLDRSAAHRGLALSRTIVERHGGTITIELDQSDAGGVRIVILLPTQRGRVLATPSAS